MPDFSWSARRAWAKARSPRLRDTAGYWLRSFLGFAIGGALLGIFDYTDALLPELLITFGTAAANAIVWPLAGFLIALSRSKTSLLKEAINALIATNAEQANRVSELESALARNGSQLPIGALQGVRTLYTSYGGNAWRLSIMMKNEGTEELNVEGRLVKVYGITESGTDWDVAGGIDLAWESGPEARRPILPGGTATLHLAIFKDREITFLSPGAYAKSADRFFEHTKRKVPANAGGTIELRDHRGCVAIPISITVDHENVPTLIPGPIGGPC